MSFGKEGGWGWSATNEVESSGRDQELSVSEGAYFTVRLAVSPVGARFHWESGPLHGYLLTNLINVLVSVFGQLPLRPPGVGRVMSHMRKKRKTIMSENEGIKVYFLECNNYSFKSGGSTVKGKTIYPARARFRRPPGAVRRQLGGRIFSGKGYAL